MYKSKVAFRSDIHTKNIKARWVLRRISRLVRKIAKNICSLRHVCPSVRVGQLASHWTDFSEIWYLNIFGKSVEKI